MSGAISGIAGQGVVSTQVATMQNVQAPPPPPQQQQTTPAPSGGRGTNVDTTA